MPANWNPRILLDLDSVLGSLLHFDINNFAEGLQLKMSMDDPHEANACHNLRNAQHPRGAEESYACCKLNAKNTFCNLAQRGDVATVLMLLLSMYVLRSAKRCYGYRSPILGLLSRVDVSLIEIVPASGAAT
ncbi:uncharacterized protein PHALS_05286 [Plasmopara halstedii]|uniref:Uncharacterized protein n=1 Tax=Plasmopara halstedii TaxID=4781 RepID=A0A0P1ABE6_PLAHL|nr:uncharacterized protein PHALS_05286 [Plasmopara halstedii]CEG37505.1 hypothetical protein PHALS_05286 [Plasmopara halstedii]|eukprot:XP_024573874.1 hypothetical protein PHALS_05286 [Plasmopara halstedii]